MLRNIKKRSYLILIEAICCLLLFVAISLIHAKSASALGMPNNYPAYYTSNVCSNFDSGSTPSFPNCAADFVNLYSIYGNGFSLWCRSSDGGVHMIELNYENGCDTNNSHSDQDAHRNQGQLSNNSNFEVLAPSADVNAQANPTTLTIEKLCKPVGDNIGWEDHMAGSPSQWINNGIEPIKKLTVSIEIPSGATVPNGLSNASIQNGTLTVGCTQNKENITIPINQTWFQADSHFGKLGGYQIEKIHFSVHDGSADDSEKVFSVKASNGFYVGPSDQSSFNGGGYVDLQNPQADYSYKPTKNCSSSAPSYCPQYSSVDQPVGPTNTFDYYFTPDCTYQSTDTTILHWQHAGGSSGTAGSGTQADAYEHWTLTDMSTGQQVARDGLFSYGGTRMNNSVNSSNTDPSANDYVGHLNPDHWYRWEWNNVDRAHGISVQLPFSEYLGVLTSNGIQFKCQWQLNSQSQSKLSTSSTYTSTVTVTTKQGDAGVQTVNFNHRVWNNGPAPATYLWRVQGKYWSNATGTLVAVNPYSNLCSGNSNTNLGTNKCPPPSTAPGCLPINNWPTNNCSVQDNQYAHVDAGGYDPSYGSYAAGVNYQFPASAVKGDKYCERIYYTDSDGQGNAGNSAEACAIYQPASSGVLACGALSTAPTEPQPGENFTATAAATGTTNGSTYKFVFHLNGTQYLSNIVTAGSSGTVSAPINGGPFNLPLAMDYSNTTTPAVSYDIENGAGTVLLSNCPTNVSIRALPYFKVYGAGVFAGGEFQNVCSGGGTLAGWNNYNGTNFGAGAQLSALALLKIVGFASGQTIAASPNAPSTFSFANAPPPAPNTFVLSTSDPTSPVTGGYFATNHCLYDAGPGSSSVSTTDVHLGGPTIYYGSSPKSYFVKDANVYIDADQTYDTSSLWTAGSAPSLVVHVENGNIYIAPGVTKLDGIFIATSDGNSGKGQIFTCANPGNPYTAGNPYTDCNQPLVVHGSFIADQVNLGRTFGTLKDGQSETSCTTDAGTNTGNPTGVSNGQQTCAAEIFDFSPEMYLSNPDIAPVNGNGVKSYDAITSLPPIL